MFVKEWIEFEWNLKGTKWMSKKAETQKLKLKKNWKITQTMIEGSKLNYRNFREKQKQNEDERYLKSIVSLCQT